MRKVIRLKYALPGILLPFVILYFFFGSGQKPGKRLHDGSSCNNQLGSDQKTDLQKIASYKFPTSVEKNISALLKGVDTIPHLPAFVTAFDSSHYIEGQELIQGLSEVRKKYPDIKLYIFDLGLKPHHKEQLQAMCRCTIQTFPFEKFPDHVRWMKGYAWKPLSIQLAIQQHPFIIWMDASVRFKTTDLDPVFESARSQGVLASVGYQSLAMRTSEGTFHFLQEDACAFRDMNEFEATFIIIYADQFVKQYFLKPWLSCALSVGCMVPPDAVPRLGTNKYLDCSDRKSVV